MGCGAVTTSVRPAPGGFVLALLIEVLTGVLTGGQFGIGVRKLVGDPGQPNNCPHLFIAIDPAAVGFGQSVADGAAALAASVKHSGTMGSTRLPGRWRTDLADEQHRSGVRWNGRCWGSWVDPRTNSR